MYNNLSNDFITGLQQLHLHLTDQQRDQFLRYRQELLDWNTRFNLTAIKDPEEVLIKHFLDSLSLLQAYDSASNIRLLDIGSGAGFPGIPLKIVRPDWDVVLLEATGKRVTFLKHMIETLSLAKCRAMQGRAEELGRDSQYRATFDVVTARAVSSFATLLEYSAPFCRIGGTIILPKKGEVTEELASGKRAATLLGTKLETELPITLPGLNDGRRLFVWQHHKLCPQTYPRSGSLIAKKPLG